MFARLLEPGMAHVLGKPTCYFGKQPSGTCVAGSLPEGSCSVGKVL